MTTTYDPAIHVLAGATVRTFAGDGSPLPGRIHYTCNRHGVPAYVVAERDTGEILRARIFDAYDADATPAAAYHGPGAYRRVALRRRVDELIRWLESPATPDTAAKLIELNDREGAYGMYRTEIIIAHPKHGLLYLSQGYGGEQELAGGAYRWRHGIVAELLPGDTLESLAVADWNEYMSCLGAVQLGIDPERLHLAWTGHMIQNCAEAASRQTSAGGC